MDNQSYFPPSFEASKEKFLASLEAIHNRWPLAQSFSHTIDSAENLSIDWIEAPSSSAKTLLLITAGEHGIEAYLGCAILQMIIEEYIPVLNPNNVGLTLVHCINPWGMKHCRRTNKANVDLNRNFVLDPLDLDRATNPDYTLFNHFLNPKGKLWGLGLKKGFFIPNLILSGLLARSFNIRSATLLGQYAVPEGIYYGGRSIQPETRVLIDLYRHCFETYDQVVHIDLHSGYGPRYRMSIVNSSFEKTPVEDHQRQFNYPLVVKTDTSKFYSINGDMIDYIYKMMARDFPQKKFYSTTFEFGTLGEKWMASVNALQTMVLENQAFHYGTRNQDEMDEIKRDIMEMFCPEMPAWRKMALDNAHQALDGILNTWGILDNKK